MTAQGVLALYCQEPGCPAELTYRGYGRPPRWCEEHYPKRAPSRLPMPSQKVRAATVTPTARRSDPDTSHAAARNLAVSADNDRGLTLLALVDGGPQHDFDLAERLGRKQTSIGVRRKELVTLGLAERAPVKPRPNRDGSLCIVWQATPAGIEKARELRGTA